METFGRCDGPLSRAMTRMLLAAAVVTLGCRSAPSGGPPPDPDRLFASLVRTATRTQSLQAEGRVTYWGDDGRVRLRTVVVAERPDRFRVETLTPFEEPIDVVTSDGTKLYWLGQGALRVGAATADNLAQVIPLPLPPPAVVDVLLGGVPTARRWVATRSEAGEHGSWRLSLTDPRGEAAQLWVQRDTTRVVRIRLAETHRHPAVDVRFDAFEDGIARRIRLEVPTRDLSVQIQLEDPLMDASPDAALFRVDPPSGRKAIPW